MSLLKKVLDYFSAKVPPDIDDCSSFGLNKEESDTLFGGFREYIPPIYEQDETADYKFRTTDILTDIHQKK